MVSGLQMDYRRFQSQAQLACYTNERDAIREYDATTPITTNLMGTFKDLDYFEWAKEMDVVSWDNYPGMDTPPSFTAMCHDLMRGIGGNKPFMLMEQTPNQQNWFPFCKVKQPGEVRKLSWQAVAHGADTVRFFQMKQSLGGCERFHGAVIAHDGTEESRVFKETAALGEELDRIGRRIMGSRIESRVAIMFDWQSYWSLEGCVGPTTGFNYPNEVHRFYRALWRRNVPVDMIASTTPLARLSQYDLAIAPALITVLPGVAETLEAYVADGGTFITGYMAGIHDEHDLVVPGGYPGKLHRLMGVWAYGSKRSMRLRRAKPSKCMAARLMPRARSWRALFIAKVPSVLLRTAATNSMLGIPRSPSMRMARAKPILWALRWTRPA